MEAFIGTIIAWAPNFAPRGWAFCNGQIMSIAQNTALFSLIGTIYGGDGKTTFALPDLRGRMPIGAGQGPGLSEYTQGESSGAETVSLNPDQLPPHTHNIQLSSHTLTRGGTVAQTRGTVVNNPPNGIHHTDPTGNGAPHNNMPPYLVMQYIICTEGIFPSRG